MITVDEIFGEGVSGSQSLQLEELAKPCCRLQSDIVDCGVVKSADKQSTSVFHNLLRALKATALLFASASRSIRHQVTPHPFRCCTLMLHTLTSLNLVVSHRHFGLTAWICLSVFCQETEHTYQSWRIPSRSVHQTAVRMVHQLPTAPPGLGALANHCQ